MLIDIHLDNGRKLTIDLDLFELCEGSGSEKSDVFFNKRDNQTIVINSDHVIWACIRPKIIAYNNQPSGYKRLDPRIKQFPL